MLPSTTRCPYCAFPECEADWTDVGVGYQQTGPYWCPQCGAYECGAYDGPVTLSPEQQAHLGETGWYPPNTPLHDTVNAVDGRPISAATAVNLYRRGLSHTDSGQPIRTYDDDEWAEILANLLG